ncbi:MAG: hypothetical protein ACR2H4_01135 [Pyrinomonadaceae bacterium]
MKPNLIKSTLFANGWRCIAVLLASVCLVWVAFISSSAQLKAQKQVTSLQLGQAAEGARVTIISDEALNDYEGFRRGDRFYVRIPQAAFSFSQPTFHGDGFDDVQVQKVGDSVVVSFKLQPGASARVDEHSNRLEVIFTAPNRSQRVNVASNPTSARVNRTFAGQNNQERQPAEAGPAPLDSSQISRERFVNVPRNESNQSLPQRVRSSRTEGYQGRTNASTSKPVATPTPLNVASPVPTPNYTATPSYTPALASSTPASSPNFRSTRIAVNSPKTLSEWISANQTGALIGALILAGLLVLAAVFFYRGRTKKPSATRAKLPLVQPKYDSDVELDEVTVPKPEPAIVSASRSSEPPQKSNWGRVAPGPVFASSAEAAAGRSAILARPSVSSVVVADRESRSEEREVFEL